MCRVSAAFANGGYLVQPHVIGEIEGEQQPMVAKKKIRHLSDPMVEFIANAMTGVVWHENGTARSSRIRGFRTAGKTGTSQNPHGEDHAWFIGYAPADDPEIAVAIIVENAGHGGAVAAPMSREFYKEYFNLEPPDTVVTQSSAPAAAASIESETE